MDNTLFMLADPKKTRKIKQSNIDNFVNTCVNNYELHKNNAFNILPHIKSFNLSFNISSSIFL